MASRVAVHFSQRMAPPALRLVGGRMKFIHRQVAALDRLGYWNPPLAPSLRLDQFKILEKLPGRRGASAASRLAGTEAGGSGGTRASA